MPVVAIANQKGGVGKTTTTLNLGAALKEAGKRVLLIDLDPQANLTISCGISSPDDVALTVGDLLLSGSIRGSLPSGQTLRDAIVASPAGLDLVPSNGKLSAAELAMVSALSRELMLRSMLRPVAKGYDYVLIDCLPSLGLIVVNALAAADGLIIPVQADYLAMQGLGQILETVAAIQERLNPDLEVYGILLTLVDQRTQHAREVVRTIRESFHGVIEVFGPEIRLQVVLKDSVKAGMSIIEYNSGSEAARAYRALGSEVLGLTGEAVASARVPAVPIGAAVAAAQELATAIPEAAAVPQASALEAAAVAPPAPEVKRQAPAETPSIPAATSPAPAVAAPAAAAPVPMPAATSTSPSVPSPVATSPPVLLRPGFRLTAVSTQAPPVQTPEPTPPSEPVETAEAQPEQSPPSRPAKFADFVARRPQWLGSDVSQIP